MEWQSCLKAFHTMLSAKGLQPFENEYHLMSRIFEISDVRNLINQWLKEHKPAKQYKSSNMSKTFKERGNLEFRKKKYAQSIQLYTKSALYAPDNSTDLPIAIANRSASLFHLCRYNDCIRDIDTAIALGYPSALQCKLYLRKVQCYLNLGNLHCAQETATELRTKIDNLKDITESYKADIENQISKLLSNAENMKDSCIDTPNVSQQLKPKVSFGENSEFPYASSGIDKVYSEEKGMHVVANRFIKRGEILFVEKPVAFVPLHEDIFANICHNCCNSCMDVPVPCSMCSDSIYCGLNCMNKAMVSSHRWECQGYQKRIWEEVGIAHLALKVLLVCTTTEDKNLFNDMQNLITNFNKLPVDDLLIYCITATMLTMYLSNYTDYFQTNNLEECILKKFNGKAHSSLCDIFISGKKELFVSCLLFRFILQLISNGHVIIASNIMRANEKESFVRYQDIVATGIYPSASIMNHSCDSNILNIFMGEFLIVRAARDVEKNEEVFNCYGPDYKWTTTIERQEMLRKQYCFTCKCEPCTIPKLGYFLEKYTGFRCPKCDDPMCPMGSVNNSLTCINCSFTLPDTHYNAVVEEANEIFYSAHILMEDEKASEALEKFKQCLDIRETVLYTYHDDILRTLHLLGEVCVRLGQWVDAISWQEKVLPAVIERFGSLSIEYADESNQLLDVCLAYLQREDNRNNESYKEISRKALSYLDKLDEIMELNFGSWSKEYNEMKKKREENLHYFFAACDI